MISLQRLVVSALLILSVTFVFFAQSAEATKGPKITHKVRTELGPALWEVGGYTEFRTGQLDAHKPL
jgi:peptidyl-prolyl cis-trans isomerase B (cyclophilin B)